MWNGQELNEDDVLRIFDDIPSDPESIDGLDDEDITGEDLANQISDVNIDVNIENLPVFLEDEFGFQQEIPVENNVGLDIIPALPREVNVGLGDVDGRPIPDHIDVNIIQEEDDTPLCIRYHDTCGYLWQKNYTTRLVDFNFSQRTGPTLVETIDKPVEFFSALFPDSLVDHIVFQTNLYCTQKNDGASNFTPTNAKEIKAFLGLNIMMGIKKLPSYRDYWSSDSVLRDQFISSAMPVNRFGWLLSNLHLNDNSNMPNRQDQNYDKLYKLRPFLDSLSSTFISCYNPTEYQTVDESMIRFKGRSSLKQYMPLKPIKRGYKVWVRADESGYICEFQIYTGKVKNRVETLLGERVVKDLTNKIKNKNHKVFLTTFSLLLIY